MGSVVKKRRKRMSKKKHRKQLRTPRHQPLNKKGAVCEAHRPPPRGGGRCTFGAESPADGRACRLEEGLAA